MTYKNKRLEKVLKKKGIKAWLKPASDSDPGVFVMIEYPKCLRHSMLYKTKYNLELVKRGEYIPEEELIHYLTIRNKRDRQTMVNKLITNKFVSIMYKKLPVGIEYPH